jgi:hypothetical protein
MVAQPTPVYVAQPTPVHVTPVAARPVAQPTPVHVTPIASHPVAQPTLHPVAVAAPPRPHPTEPSPRITDGTRVPTRPMNPARVHIAPVALQPVAVHRVVVRPSPIAPGKAENF